MAGPDPCLTHTLTGSQLAHSLSHRCNIWYACRRVLTVEYAHSLVLVRVAVTGDVERLLFDVVPEQQHLFGLLGTCDFCCLHKAST